VTRKHAVVVIIAAVLVAGFATAARVYRTSASENATRAVERAPGALDRASAKTFGPSDALVHIVEFMDPGCETCRAFHPFLHSLVDQNAGKVRVSIRYLPLHDGADVMVRILEAADRQGKYWETLQLMFDSQPQWASHHHPQPEKIWPLLPGVGLDVEAIRRDMLAPEITAILDQDLADAQALGLRKTPSFFVNGEPLQVFGDDTLRALVDKQVASRYP
jgi:protein-disulfide isomerase